MTTLEDLWLAALRVLASTLHGLAAPAELTLAARLAAAAALALEAGGLLALRTLREAKPARGGEATAYDEAA